MSLFKNNSEIGLYSRLNTTSNSGQEFKYLSIWVWQSSAMTTRPRHSPFDPKSNIRPLIDPEYWPNIEYFSNSEAGSSYSPKFGLGPSIKMKAPKIKVLAMNEWINRFIISLAKTIIMGYKLAITNLVITNVNAW